MSGDLVLALPAPSVGFQRSYPTIDLLVTQNFLHSLETTFNHLDHHKWITTKPPFKKSVGTEIIV